MPRTGQTTCYKATGSVVITCPGTGQDGASLAGKIWPFPRFIDNSDRTISDLLTGLVWSRDANPGGVSRNWQQALDYIRTLNSQKYLGFDDWRLSNLSELESLVNKETNLAGWLGSQGFTNLRVDSYWTSTTYASYSSYAWSVAIYGGMVAGRSKSDLCHVWPVRGGRSGSIILPKTGQTTCYDNAATSIDCAGTGQDAEFQAGTGWPSPRFIENTDQTMSDRLTGLIWTRNGKAPGPAACNPGRRMNWQDALDYVKCLNTNNFLGTNDWRLPNRNELKSLVNHGQANSSSWLNTNGFTDVQASNYWSSTSYSYATWNAWSINMQDGAVSSIAKKINHDVWPVRGDQ